MSGIAAPNLRSFTQDDASATSRNGEYPDTPFTDVDGDGAYNTYLGMNRTASNPGAGVNTGDLTMTAAEVAEVAAGAVLNNQSRNWSQLDQDEAPRIPQDSQVIGGGGFVPRTGNVATTWDASQALYTPNGAASSGGAEGPGILPVTFFTDPGTVPGTPDANNTANLVITDTAAADGAVMDTVSGALNNTGATVAIGDLIWGQVPVA